MSRRSLTVEDLKSVGSDWMFERGTNVEIRRHFSEETREALSEEQHIEADVDRDCFPISARIQIGETRTLDRAANGSLLTGRGVADKRQNRENSMKKRSRTNSSV
jgi:hypothetical protein